VLDVPVSVSIVSERRWGGPRSCGTVTTQTASVGQRVGASCPPTDAWTRPSGLKKLAPEMVSTCPDAATEGMTVKSQGWDPGSTRCFPVCTEPDRGELWVADRGDAWDTDEAVGCDCPA
jgi:hypothetical protein